MLYFADSDWWEWHRENEQFKAFAGAKVTIEPSGLRVGDPDVFMLHNAGRGDDGLVVSMDPRALVTGFSGGYQVVNLAMLAGAQRIVLLGYDMKQGVQGRNNWHNAHRRSTPAGHYQIYRRAFRKLPPLLSALGVEVLNATPDSALTDFPKVELARLLPDPQPAGVSA